MNNIENNPKQQWVVVMPDAYDPFFLKLEVGYSLSTLHDIECFYSKEGAHNKIVEIKGQQFLDDMLEKLEPVDEVLDLGDDGGRGPLS